MLGEPGQKIQDVLPGLRLLEPCIVFVRILEPFPTALSVLLLVAPLAFFLSPSTPGSASASGTSTKPVSPFFGGVARRYIRWNVRPTRLTTVKWHTGNIYGKLSVENRTQAVAKLRSLGILV